MDSTSVVAKVPARTVLVPSLKLVSTRRGGKRTYHFTLGNVGVVVANRVTMCVTAPAHGTIVSASGARIRRGRACWPTTTIPSGVAHRVTIVVHSTRGVAPKWTARASNASVRAVRVRKK